MEISLSSRVALEKILKDKFYADHLKIYDLEKLDGLKKMSQKQWKYFLVLLSKKQWFKIKELLDKFLTHKQYETITISTKSRGN